MARNIEACGVTDVGRVRKNNEDALLIADLTTQRSVPPGRLERLALGSRGLLLAVSDGLGGHAAGEVASAVTVAALFEALAHEDARALPPAERLSAAVQQADARVCEAAKRDSREGMASTVTAVVVCGDDAYVAEVGDSRAYLLRGGELFQLTHDQSYVQWLIDSGGMSEKVARQSRLRNVILQAVGEGRRVEPALSRLSLRRDDRLLLCSDGLSGKVAGTNLRAILASETALEAICQRLIDAANARGGDDNITAIVAAVEGEDWPPSQRDERFENTFEMLRSFDGGLARSDSE